MKLLQILNEIQVPNIMSHRMEVDGKALLISSEDQGGINWYEATEFCEKLGDGKWRLPTLKELIVIYKKLHKKGKGNFENDYYWCDPKDYFEHTTTGPDHTWYVNFKTGKINFAHKNFKGRVRPVRDPLYLVK